MIARIFSLTALLVTVLIASNEFDQRAAESRPQRKTSHGLADLVVVHARIWKGSAKDCHPTKDAKEPTALAVKGNTIVAVGSDAIVRGWMGPDTKLIDAGNRRMIPGLTDSHTHLISGGLQQTRLALRKVKNRTAFIRAVQKDASTKVRGEWVLGGRWSVESWTKPESPTRLWLDPVTGDTPVFLTRMDGHQVLVNSAALKIAGIDASGPLDPPGGEIERNPQTGEPTGILKESAMGLIRKYIADPTASQRYGALLGAIKHANTLGLTSVHDMSDPADLAVFQRAEEEGELTVRITSYLQEEWLSNLDAVAGLKPHGRMLRVAGLKGYMDGSLGSRTAYMRKAYSDAPADSLYPRGQLTAFARSSDSFRQAVAMVDRRGLQMAVHAIGDEANHLLLDAYEAAQGKNHRSDARHRIEHAQHLLLSDMPRFAKLGVVASMQPFHKADDGRYAEQRLGPQRLRGGYAYRQLLDTGAVLCFGSDWPVVTLNPFAGIDAAVNARILSGKVWLASHSVTVEEAIRAYTASPAWAVHQEDRLGTLEVGKLADMVILTEDPFEISKDHLGAVTAQITIVEGKVVYTRQP